jgi:ribonuclease HI
LQEANRPEFSSLLLTLTMDCLKRPHYLLISESSQLNSPGRWRFVLRPADGGERIVADDVDPEARGDRLELLTVVRGLEALEQPSRVTLWTPNTYVREGIRNGLREWRENGWLWEYFGSMVPVKNDDLWRRLDRAMMFHEVDCRTWRVDAAHSSSVPTPQSHKESARADSVPPIDGSRIEQIREKLGDWRASIGRSLTTAQGTTRLA